MMFRMQFLTLFSPLTAEAPGAAEAPQAAAEAPQAAAPMQAADAQAAAEPAQAAAPMQAADAQAAVTQIISKLEELKNVIARLDTADSPSSGGLPERVDGHRVEVVMQRPAAGGGEGGEQAH